MVITVACTVSNNADQSKQLVVELILENITPIKCMISYRVNVFRITLSWSNRIFSVMTFNVTTEKCSIIYVIFTPGLKGVSGNISCLK